jgi:hypothetical protein
MFCPQCEGEYREGIEMCPTCEAVLIADLAERPPEPPGPMPARLASAMIDLIGFVDEAEARSARAALKAANVSCELVIREAFGPGSGRGADEYWIRVPAGSAAAAATALGSAGLSGAEHQTAAPDLREDACPSCGAPLGPDEDCPRCAPQ